MDGTMTYPYEEILLVGQLPCKDLAFGIRRMKTRHFTATLVHRSVELALKGIMFELITISKDWDIQIVDM